MPGTRPPVTRAQIIALAAAICTFVANIIMPAFSGDLPGSDKWLIVARIAAVVFFVVLVLSFTPNILRIASVILDRALVRARPRLSKVFQQVLTDSQPLLAQLVATVRPQTLATYELEGAVLKKEGYRHISLRVETIHIILEALLDAADGVRKLRALGREVGSSFAQNTWTEMSFFRLRQQDGPSATRFQSPPATPEDLKKRIKLWADMEVTAGWGGFQPEIHATADAIWGTVTVYECFLAIGRSPNRGSLCPFLEGYLEAILTDLIARPVRIQEMTCGIRGGVDRICRFRVEQATIDTPLESAGLR